MKWNTNILVQNLNLESSDSLNVDKVKKILLKNQKKNIVNCNVLVNIL